MFIHIVKCYRTVLSGHVKFTWRILKARATSTYNKQVVSNRLLHLVLPQCGSFNNKMIKDKAWTSPIKVKKIEIGHKKTNIIIVYFCQF